MNLGKTRPLRYFLIHFYDNSSGKGEPVLTYQVGTTKKGREAANDIMVDIVMDLPEEYKARLGDSLFHHIKEVDAPKEPDLSST